MVSKTGSMLDALPLHGGDIVGASERYGIPQDQWLDLSTGVNPWAYPVGAIPEHVFQHLPYLQKTFVEAVVRYYGHASFIAVAGTQSAIQILPDVVNEQKHWPVLVPKTGYTEHEQCWSQQGHVVQSYCSHSKDALVNSINTFIDENPKQHIVVINPNNPTGVCVDKAQLLMWANAIDSEAYLIIDEAFIDVSPENSVLSETRLPSNVIVLRSFGKFFGLAGIRLGFVFTSNDASNNYSKSYSSNASDSSIYSRLQQRLGLWQVNGPAQYIARKALNDELWQEKTIQRLSEHRVHVDTLFAPLAEFKKGPQPVRNMFFTSIKMSLEDALFIYNAFAEQGILSRVVVLDDGALLRLGVFDSRDVSSVERIRECIERLCQKKCVNGQ